MERLIPIGAIALLVLTTTTSTGSLVSTGPNGINSRGIVVRLPDGVTPLTGMGVSIGQVEALRPGWPLASGGPDDAAHSNPSVKPTDVTIGEGEAVTPNMDIGVGHATQVAGVLISQDTTDSSVPANGDDPRGVAPNANLYSSAYITDGAGIGYTEALLTTQYVADVTDTRAINHSWQKPLSSGGALDGNTQLTLGMDWIASTYDVLNVIAGNQGGKLTRSNG